MAASMCQCLWRLQKLKLNTLWQKVDTLNLIVSSNLCTNFETEYYEDEEVEKLRDVSRLPRGLKKRVHQVPFRLKPAETQVHNIKAELLKDKKYQRKLFARYGFESGVDPRNLWPTRGELRQTKEWEERFEPPLQEKLAEVQRAKMERERIDRERIENVTVCMEKMPKLLEKYHEEIEEEEKTTVKGNVKREAMLREIREELGLYNVSLYDKRILMRLEFKIQQEKLEKKEKKKKDRKDRLKSSLFLSKVDAT